MGMDSGMWSQFVLSLLLKKIIVPTDFHNQCQAIKEMSVDDVTGLVDSLTDFYVQTASVKFGVEADNEEYSRILKNWLNNINVEYNGKIPVGINELAKEYYKERWKGSSFPVLKISKWHNTEGGIIVPTNMFFVDGASITAKDLNKDEDKTLIGYDYYIGKKQEAKYKLDKNCVFTRPYGRWFDKYPTPFLIKRGIYHNFKIIESLKNQQTQILDQIIPYLLLIKKGSPELVKENVKKGYSTEELNNVVEQFQKLMEDIKSTNLDGNTIHSPIRATNFDEEIKHLIPDLKTVFEPELFVTAERNILSGLGFIDIIEATSSSRKESVLNPKGCIEEVKSGVEGMEGIVEQLLLQIKQKNKSHKKYMNVETAVVHSPVKGFMTDDFKDGIRSLYDRGVVSAQTAVELIGEVSFETEVKRREKEAKRGIEYIMYPHLRDNKEDKGLDFPTTKKDPEKLTPDKTGPEAKNYKIASTEKDLVTAPYKTKEDLPANIKKSLSPKLQSVFMKVFNQAYKKYGNDSKSFRIAWGVIKNISKKNKTGKWIKSTKLEVTKATIEEIEKAVIKEEK